jgi:hypothetical protein
MRGLCAVLVAATLHLAAFAALCAAHLDDGLPPVFGKRPIICILGSPERFSRLSLLQGETRANVERALGAPQSAAAASHECVRFAYGSRVGLTALFREGTLRHIWVTEAASVPESCPARPVRNVPVEARAWYPVSAAGDTPTGSRIPSS